ncbi:MAG: YHS domain-containing (seleno)protein [Ferruginibacter sp.]
MKKITTMLIASFFMIAITNAQTALRTKEFNLEKGLAIQGYDPVAYFTQNKAVKGAKQFAALAEGVTYYFSTAANKDLFIKDYKKYEPQYGGWCAYAMGASNEKVEIDPETFKIVNGKLFLFYHTWVNNTLTKWNKDEANLKAKADKNWAVFFR